MLLEVVDIHMQRGDHVAARFSGSGHGPVRQLAANRLLRELDRLHHLADEAIGQNHHRIAISIGEFKGQRGQVGHLLHGMRRQHDGAVVAVASAFHHLVIIALLRRRCCPGPVRRA